MTKLTFVLALALLTGCGSGEPFDHVPVSGQITYEDGSPLPGKVQLNFYPQVAPIDSQTHPRPGVAYTDEQGKFDVATTHRWGDGLIRGTHKVAISTEVRQVVPAGVPAEYNDLRKTPLTIDADKTPLIIKIRKP
jgi:hypothetical protein